MDINNHIKNKILKLKVIPNSKQTKLSEENNQLKLHLKAPPQKGKANEALIKYFKKHHKLTIKIKSGKTSREKTLQIID